MLYNIDIYNTSARKFLPQAKLKKTVENTLKGEKINSASIAVILVTDEAIHELNQRYLKHNQPTDVITFPLGESDEIEGEIYISVDTAAAQAEEYNVSLTNELMRLAAHGALHLAGYDDNTIEKRNIMHELESLYINF